MMNWQCRVQRLAVVCRTLSCIIQQLLRDLDTPLWQDREGVLLAWVLRIHTGRNVDNLCHIGSRQAGWIEKVVFPSTGAVT